jgi:MFS family permease
MEHLELVAHAKEFDESLHHHQEEAAHVSHDNAANHATTSAEKPPRAAHDVDKQEPANTAAPHPIDAATTSIDPDNAPAKDRGWAAWRFVLASATMEFMVWGASYGYGSFQDYHQHSDASPFHTASLTSTSSIGTTLLAGQHFIPLVAFGLYSMFPSLIKTFTYTCVVASALSLLIASFAQSVALLIVFQGLLLGIFGGNLFTTTILWLPNWFDKRRGFATALIFAGSAVGGILWPILFTQMLERIGFRWTLRAWALMQLVVSGGAVLCLQPGCRLGGIQRPIRWKRVVPGFPRSLLSPLTLLNAGVILTQTTAWYSVSLNISNYATAMGFSSATSTGVLSAFNASAAVTYFVLGYLVDRFPYPLIMATSTTLNLVFTVLVFGFAGGSLTKIIVYVVFFGISGGGFSSFLTPMSREIKDKAQSDEFSLRFLYLVCIRGLAAMCGPIIAVQFYPDQLGKPSAYGSFGFTPFIAFISATLAISTLASLVVFVYKRYNQPRLQRRKASLPVTPPPEPSSAV